jgi:hypothetical protein
MAGVAAGVAAAAAGDRVVLREHSSGLGGAAVAAHHRTLCGFFANDTREPQLLEPGMVEAWLPFMASGKPLRRGRVWLLPTDPQTLSQGLLRRIHDHGVETQFNCGDDCDSGFDRVIDARGVVMRGRAATQWGAWRCAVWLGEIPAKSILRRIAEIHPGQVALEALAGGRWQLTIDASEAAQGLAAVERINARLGAQAVEHIGFIERDLGGCQGLTLAELFSTAHRGLCWASWPCEFHHARGVDWVWPPGSRYGVPEQVTMSPTLPRGWRVCGRGLAAQPQAAAALRVTGSAVMIGNALGTNPWTC